MCQDTGTAIVMGKKSEGVLTGIDDGEAISRGVYDAYTQLNLRYSPARAADDLRGEEHRHQPAGADRDLLDAADVGPMGKPEYKFLFMAKGGGSANKSFLFQETKAILNPDRLLTYLDEKIRSLGTAACPPYHLAVVIGGTSAEFALKTAKYASAHYLDNLPTVGVDERPRLPRPRARGGGLQAHPVLRDRRAVRRQVLLPRRPRRPAPPPRRLVPGRDRRLLLGRPPGAGQDHRRGRLPRAARDRPGAVHAVGRRLRRDRRRRGRQDRPEPADGLRSSPSCRSTR